MGWGYQHPQQLLLPADPASSFSQFWALRRVAWGRYLTQETMSGQRVAAGGVCGLWRTPRASPRCWLQFGLPWPQLPCPSSWPCWALPWSPAGTPRGQAEQPLLTSLHREPPPEGKVGTSGRKGLPGLGASCAESEQERETQELRSRGRCRFGAAKRRRSPRPAPSAPFFCPQGLGFTGWGCQCPGLLLPSGF